MMRSIMKVPDTNLEIEKRKYNNPNIIRLLSSFFSKDACMMILWDNFNGMYGMRVTVEESNYPTAPNSYEDYYYVIDSNSFYVSLDGDEREYPESLKNKSFLSKTARGIITEASKFYPTRVFDCIILDSSNYTKMGRCVGIGSNSNGEELFDIKETARCSKVLYISV